MEDAKLLESQRGLARRWPRPGLLGLVGCRILSLSKILLLDRVVPFVRLELRRKLHPYATLLELADAMDVTLPSLKRHLRELEARNDLSLENLALSMDVRLLRSRHDDLFVAFHQYDLCLVCGSPMEEVQDRQAGWGEFKQCRFCKFSAHENADFERLREVATAQLSGLEAAVKEAHRIFGQRTRRGRALRPQPDVRIPGAPG